MIDNAINKLNFQDKVHIGAVFKANDLWSAESDGYFLDAKKATDEDGIVKFSTTFFPIIFRLIFTLVLLSPSPI